MIARLIRGTLVCVAASAILLVSAATAPAIPPFVNFSIDATGNTAPTAWSASAPNGWYNVPVTLKLTDIVWDDPLHAGHYDIASVTCSRNGGAPAAVVPTSTLTLSADGLYTVSCEGSWGGSAYPIVVGIDRTPPASNLTCASTHGGGRVTIAVADAGAGPAAVSYSVDGGAETSRAVSAVTHSVSFEVTSGAHAVGWFAVDNANNAENPAHQTTLKAVATPALLLGRPTARVRDGRVTLAGSITPQKASTIVTLVVERRAASVWRRYERVRTRVRAGARGWRVSALSLPRGRYRVHAVACGAQSAVRRFSR